MISQIFFRFVCFVCSLLYLWFGLICFVSSSKIICNSQQSFMILFSIPQGLLLAAIGMFLFCLGFFYLLKSLDPREYF